MAEFVKVSIVDAVQFTSSMLCNYEDLPDGVVIANVRHDEKTGEILFYQAWFANSGVDSAAKTKMYAGDWIVTKQSTGETFAVPNTVFARDYKPLGVQDGNR